MCTWTVPMLASKILINYKNKIKIKIKALASNLSILGNFFFLFNIFLHPSQWSLKFGPNGMSALHEQGLKCEVM